MSVRQKKRNEEIKEERETCIVSDGCGGGNTGWPVDAERDFCFVGAPLDPSIVASAKWLVINRPSSCCSSDPRVSGAQQSVEKEAFSVVFFCAGEGEGELRL